MGNVNMEAYQVHYRGDESVADHLHAIDNDIEKAAVLPDLPTAEGKTVLTAVTDGQGDTELTYETPEVESEDIAPEFSEDEAYSEGDLVYYEGILYKFSADHAAGTWDPSEVTQTTVAAEFNELKNTLTNVTERISANTLANAITALTFDTEYVAAADGYLRGIANPGTSKYISLKGKLTDDTWYTLAQAGDTTIISDVISLFVRKGMSVKFTGSSSTDVSCYFIPLTSND